MLTFKKITTDSEYYPYVEELMQTAFPEQERRDAALQRTVTDDEPLFSCHVLLDEDRPIGLLTYWKLSDFYYIEHFAIDFRCRGGGYGACALETLKSLLHPAPLVLEVEEPTDELSIRRISFYRRQGFVLHDVSYQQPPYRPGDSWFPLKLMSFGPLDIHTRFPEIRDLIHHHVYGV